MIHGLIGKLLFIFLKIESCSTSALRTTFLPHGYITTIDHQLCYFSCTTDVYARCPEGYSLFNGRCFVLNTHARNFDQAETECNKLPGGHLAAIRSADDFEFLKELRSEYYLYNIH